MLGTTSVSSMNTDGQNPSSEISFSELICPESQILQEIGRLVDIVNPKKSKTKFLKLTKIIMFKVVIIGDALNK